MAKKSKNSITMLIEPDASDDSTLFAACPGGRDCIGREEIRDLFGSVPDRPYLVTFEIDPKGKFIVDSEDCTTVLRKMEKVEGITEDTNGLLVGPDEDGPVANVCFLNKHFCGKTVTRTVRVLPRRKN